MDEKPSPKKALVIGCSRGIGRAIALRLAKDGFDIVGTARRHSTEVESLATELAAMGRRFDFLAFDVTDRQAAANAYREYFGEGGAPEVVIYNSGVNADNLFVFMTPEEWDKVIQTNVNGFYNAVQPLIFGMLAHKSGRIVVISSASGRAGQAGQVNYSASKAALIGAAKALAREVGRKNILVNVVAPGLIATDMTKDLPLEKYLPYIPLHRPGKPEEVAAAVSFLCGEDGTYVHGQVIDVNGGLVI